MRLRPPAWSSCWLAVLCLLSTMLAGCEQNAGCSLVMVTQVPIQFRNRLPTVEVNINGHAARMVLDTGSNRSLVSEPAKQRLGLVEDQRFMTAIIGVAVTTMKVDVTVDSMMIGAAPLSVDRIMVGAVPLGAMADGLLGMDVLREFDLDIDVPKRLLSLYRVRQCETADPPWDEPAVPIRGITTQFGRLGMPLELDGVEAAAVIDTGAAFTTIGQRMAQRLGLTEQKLADDQVGNIHGVGASSSRIYIHQFQSIRIGPLMERNVRLPVLMVDPQRLPNGNPVNENLIGQDVLGNRRIWFSFKTDRVAISLREGDQLAKQ